MATIAVLERHEAAPLPVAIPPAIRDGQVSLESFGSRDCLMAWLRFIVARANSLGAGASEGLREPVVVVINSGDIDDTTIAILHDLRRFEPRAHVSTMVVSDKRDHVAALRAIHAGATDVFLGERGEKEWGDRLLRVLERSRNGADWVPALLPRLHLGQNELGALPGEADFSEEAGRQLDNAFGAPLALHVVRIDSFRTVGNALGPEVARKLMEVCLNRLRASLGTLTGNSPEDCPLVGRYGADGFSVLQREVGGRPEVEALARQILAHLTAPCLIDGRRIGIAATIGVAVYPGDGGAFDRLLHNASLAADRAGERGEPLCFYHAGILADARRIAELDLSLRNALATQQFVLQFQPQVSLLTGKLIGAEALLRWRGADGKLMTPGTFLPYAEKSGLIAAIDEWVLSQACRTARHWHDVGLALRISVNMSAARFAERSIPGLVSRVLQDSGLEPRYLDLEMTESAVMEDIADVSRELAAIRSLGVSVSIDDFGVGYSSLHAIRQLHADRLKIDRNFVRHLAENHSDRMILSTIINLGHELGFDVVAEGVETADQLAVLRDEKCDEVQGFLFARPMSTSDFMAYAQRVTTASDMPGDMAADIVADMPGEMPATAAGVCHSCLP